MDIKTCAMATMPSRLPYLQKSIRSIIEQVDELKIYCNGFEELPDLGGIDIDYGKIEMYLGPDLGSAGRFFWAELNRGYYITIDDDLEYPPNYVEYMISKVEEYKRQAIITLHGKILEQPLVYWIGTGPGRMKAVYACLARVDNDYDCHVAGTGASVYHANTLKIKMSDFKNRNLDDVEFSILAQKQNAPIIVVKHDEGFLKYLFPPDSGTIWAETIKNPWPLIRLAQSHQWRLIKLAPQRSIS